MLAEVDGQSVWLVMGTVTGVLMVVLGIWNLFYTVSVASRAARIDTLEKDLGATTRALIDQQIGGIAQAYKVAYEAFSTEIKEINERMRRGDSRFAIIEKEKHQLEVDILKQLRSLSENVATKQDLMRMREEMRRPQ